MQTTSPRWFEHARSVRRNLRGYVKRGALHASKWLGIFALARRLTRRKLRILCYHGIALGDEYLYAPGLFMRPDTIRSRYAILRRGGYAVLPLDKAVEQLQTGTLPNFAVVITYDDGFFGNFVHGVSLQREFGLPATVYVTTYYVVNPCPIFRHAIRYMLWKTSRTEVDLSGIPGVDGGVLPLTDPARTDEVIWNLIRYAETSLDGRDREMIARMLGERFGVDYRDLSQSRRLSLMNLDEIRALADVGFDVQLHTHRHQFPRSESEVRREIEDNRAILAQAVPHPRRHLCYPSGVYSPEQWPWLEALEIRSATTCENGLNDASTPRLGLRRFLDAESVSAIEFEAELSGFAELARGVRALFFGKTPARVSGKNYEH